MVKVKENIRFYISVIIITTVRTDLKSNMLHQLSQKVLYTVTQLTEGKKNHQYND